MAAGVVCGSCGTELRANAKFCDECGMATGMSSDTAKYKQVTVLFADVVRSTAIAAAVDLERLREIMTELLERAAAVIERYGGTAEYNGDGVMALFGAPVALEDHAHRACLAALAIQEAAAAIADEVLRRDGVSLQLRVGLNSGRVIVGDIGSGALGYAATGATVGFAQRMESAAPPGGVMLSESTARLVEGMVKLGEPEWMQVKGSEEPVLACRLLAAGQRDARVTRAEVSLVGRRWEMAALDAIIDRAVGGRGCVVSVVGPPGIGKSRIAREAASLAGARGVEVFWTFCESHARDIPFHAVTRLLRAGSGVADLDGEAARAQLRAAVHPDEDPEDLALLTDLIGVADPDVPLPQIDPEARRRRLTALVNATTMARTEPALFIIEDAHWVDAVSESMLADFLTVIPRTPTAVLITARPEYEGALTRVRGGQAIALAPLGDSDTATLIGELMGADPSVGELATVIADRAAGNPFFAEEMVRELVQRGVLTGTQGEYVCHADVAELSVPATVQAAIEARIDRLAGPARRTLDAASVIGARFSAELLAALDIDGAFDELLESELIDQVRFTPHAEYAFRHPLIRAVTYESQLKSDRAEWHRRLAAAIETRTSGSAEENAVLIAEHLESAGELRPAYDWHMRAGASLANRDIGAARRSWDRARMIADRLPDDDPGHLSMRIAPRTMLCGTAWRVQTTARFDELRELCTAAGDTASLAFGMAELVMDHAYHGRIIEAAQLASEHMALTESIGDPNLTVGLSTPGIYAKTESAEHSEMLRWTETVIDLADGDATMGNFIFGSPLAYAYASRAIARYCLGRPGWQADLRHGLDLGRSTDPLSYAAAVSLSYFGGIPNGVVRPSNSVVQEIQDALSIAERSGDDLAVTNVRMALGMALAHRDTAAERQRGHTLLAEASEIFVRREHNLAELPIVNLYVLRDAAGGRDDTVPPMRSAVDHLFGEGRLLWWGPAATGVLVETLLARGGDADVAEAEAAVERLADAPADDELVLRDIWLLRLRTLLARARGNDAARRDLATRYLAMAESLSFEGHSDAAAQLSSFRRGQPRTP